MGTFAFITQRVLPPLLTGTLVTLKIIVLAIPLSLVIGTLTALLAASIAVVQREMKKILAYSTVSQLGFMFAAVGVGFFAAGFFHVFTHAFFKALLFLGAGSVNHATHTFDMRLMGSTIFIFHGSAQDRRPNCWPMVWNFLSVIRPPKIVYGCSRYLRGSTVVDLTSLSTKLVWIRATPGMGVIFLSRKFSKSLVFWVTTLSK